MTSEPGLADRDQGRAELVESSGMQNALVGVGLSALLMVPVAWALTKLKQAVTNNRT